ncbi:hypothetical protein LXM94_07885 [Rhizobium sp. TRM95111]|uniref:hypothetical protein n=1 Tax=Rhizobium alarense TaxID=2846851 RepID=UPI001F2E9FA9|nr:hypothetical protein [Rhizobium alarense]MCF3639887.1 hypothetical protein [Rhizobium alarense]
MEAPVHDPALFGHVRIVIGMVVSLSLARLLTGLALFVQHPGRNRVYWIHLGWVLSLFLFILHFWWWEFRLQTQVIGFGIYLFLICFGCLFFFLSVLLLPTSIEDYSGYEHYFMSRRRWFFGLLALAYAVDLVDTAIKGADYFRATYFEPFGYEYPLRNVSYILLCCIAAATANRRFHAAFVVGGLVYQVIWIFRAFDLL